MVLSHNDSGETNVSSQKPLVEAFFDKASNTFSYVIQDPSGDACAVVDPVLDYDPASGTTRTDSADRIIEFVRNRKLRVEWLLETHVHADHLSSAAHIQSQLGGKIGIGEKIRDVQAIFGEVFNAGPDFARDGSQFDHVFEDGEQFAIGALQASVLHTPGHTPACLSYYIGDAVFVGDTLFMPDYGTARCDFPGGDARTLFRSIRKVLSLPDQTRMFLCHDYLPEGRSEALYQTTVGAQKAGNIHVNDGVEEEAFVQMRQARDRTLGMPKLILPSVQINMRAGHFPPPEDNGQIYLKIPLNRF